MAPVNLIRRTRWGSVEGIGTDDKTTLIPLIDWPEVEPEIRILWANRVMEYFAQPTECLTSIRAWDFVFNLDGSVESCKMPSTEDGLIEGYPIRFQIPINTLNGLDQKEKVRRAERFAMASLIYEIMTGEEPFEELFDKEVQRLFALGEVPRNIATVPYVLYILSGWSEEFSQELAKRVKPNLVQAIKNHAKAHPVAFGFQTLGATITLVSLCAVPALGAIGFGAAGPVLGSTAAAWQSSIGIVQAGTLFTWCQSAGMGGAALGAIQAAGVAGASLGVAGTALAKAGDPNELLETYKRGFRKS